MAKTPARELIASTLIEALRKERLARNLSMSAVAQGSGLHVSMISLVERGLRKPTLDVLLRIAEALDVDLWPLLKYATEMAKKQRTSERY